jgi:hypothetical protein
VRSIIGEILRELSDVRGELKVMKKYTLSLSVFFSSPLLRFSSRSFSVLYKPNVKVEET